MTNSFFDYKSHNALLYRQYPEESDNQKELKQLNEGFIGWFGMGGSLFQWNPDLEIAFAFTPTLLHWYDIYNVRSLRYLHQTVKCIQMRN